MKSIQLSDIPPVTHDSREARLAFARVLNQVFRDHGVLDYEQLQHRKSALAAIMYPETTLDDSTPRLAAFLSVDTGAPNDEILSAYVLLFT